MKRVKHDAITVKKKLEFVELSWNIKKKQIYRPRIEDTNADITSLNENTLKYALIACYLKRSKT